MNSSAEKAPVLRSPITFDDLAADLIWPQLLRAGPLSFSPVRLGLSLFLFFVIALVLGACLWVERVLSLSDPALITAGVPASLRFFSLRELGAHPGGAAWRLIELFISLPWLLVLAHPIAATIGVLLSLIAWSVAGGAISRSAAEEFSTGRSLPWPGAIALALRYLRSLLAAVAGPIVLVWLLWLGLAAGGFLLFRLPVLDLIGGVLYGLALFGGAAAMLLMGAYALGHWMLIPAVMCEGTDAIDAVQRAYSYVFGRTSRLLGYGLILAAQGLILGWIVWFLSAGAAGITARATSAWAGGPGRTAIETGATHAATADHAGAVPQAETAGPTRRGAAFMVGVWSWIPTAFPFAFGVSFLFTGSTLLYLACRRINDGQDMNELWSPASSATDRSSGRSPSSTRPERATAPDSLE